MATDIFLKVKGVDGESQDDKHSKEIQVLSFTMGAENSGTSPIGQGTGAGKVKVKDLKVRKYVDKASPNLFLFCCNGKPIDECKLTVRKAGETPLEYMIITMSQCIVSSVAVQEAAENDLLIEEMTLNFAKVKYEYNPQKPDGTGEGVVAVTWDIAKSKSE